MTVSLFVTCLADLFYPEVAASAVRVLRRHGVRVSCPSGQTCCGQPAFNSGFHREARSVARSLVRALAGSERVVTPSGSCAAMLTHYLPGLLDGDRRWGPAARELAGAVQEFSCFLVRTLGLEDLGARFPARAVYHRSCHMTRLLGAVDEPLVLLRRVRGLELVELPHATDCCGFGGAFSVKLAPVSGAMAGEKAAEIMASGADFLVGADLGCLMNLGGRLRRLGSRVRVMHLAQVLDEGTRPRGVRVAG